nr:reverse transcriptase domain-containing protein [Tanacetum cinerariifolium]
MIKFPVAGGIVTLRSSRIIPLECSMVSEPGVPRPVINQVTEEKIQVAIHPEYPEQTIAIGSTLIEEGRKELCGLLRCHLDVKGGQAPERNKAISKEVKKLVEADILKEVHYHSWLSNPVMVKKHDDSWRMYVDFKDLNKACPKDGYPLPKIDWKVESLYGYPYKCFLDAYKGYHQIKMAEEDEEKTSFITSQGIFCYSKMSFGLKNAGATYQRLVDKAFQKQIGRNLEVYVDDLVIKIRTEKEVIRDIEETFKTLREINMKLNPKKCAFGMREGTFLGYKVDADGLRVCPDKVEAVLDLPSPKCLKDVQKLNGKLASLNRFLSKSAEKSLPFLKTLKKCTKKSDFQWIAEAEVAFKEMKQLVAELPMLTAPREKEETSVKGQILADFIVERPEDDTPDTSIEDREELPEPWILFTDGSSCIDGSGAGLIIINPKGMEFTYALRFRFNTTNNEVEYEALIVGLRIAGKMGVQNLQANVDSKLVANHVNGIYIAKESSMIKYLEKVKNLASTFKGFSIKQIPRGENKKADALSKITSTSFAPLSKKVLVEELREKAIDEKETLAVVEEEGYTWMTPVYEYLTEWILPEEKKKARVVRHKAGRYAMINEVLYKNNPSLAHGCERANRSLRKGIKARLGDKNKNWIEEISHVLWAYRTMIKSNNGETPFLLTYGAEAVILAEIGMPTLKTAEVDMIKNNKALGISLDLLEEKRKQAAVQEAKSKAKMERYYNARVRNTSFHPGDFVYRNNEASHMKDGGKLGPK